jgi:hypothetical protein
MSAAVRAATKHEAFVNLTKKAQQSVVFRGSDQVDAYLRELANAWAPTIAEVRASLNQ